MGIILSTLRDTIKSLRSAVSLLSDLSSEFNAALQRASQSPGLPKPNPTKSYWLEDPPFPHLTNIQSSELPSTADVAIIGSGIAGAAIARSLLHERRRRNIDTNEKVVVLEARELCSGATARNGGHIKASPYEAFSHFSKSYSKERAAALTRFRMRHVSCLVELCRSERIDGAEAREVETVDLFLDEKTFCKAVRYVEETRKWVPEAEVEIWDAKQAQEKFGVNEGVVGALSYTAGAIWAYRFVISIWQGLQEEFSNTLSIETNTPVEEISVSKEESLKDFPYAIKTPRGTIYVRHVVHATNGFTSHLVPGLRRSIVGARAHMSAQRPGSHFPVTQGMRSWSIIYGDAFDYVTQRPVATTPNTTQGDLMVGGGFMRSLKQGVDQVGLYNDADALDPLTLSHITGIMPAIFHPRWGPGAELKKVWPGILGMTGDLLPLVGPLAKSLTGRDTNHYTEKSRASGGKGGGEWIAAGFSGDGMVWAWLCGVALGIMIAECEDEELEAVPGRPGGRLNDWFPGELRVSGERVRRADVANLADSI